jgi:hypothetical protein
MPSRSRVDYLLTRYDICRTALNPSLIRDIQNAWTEVDELNRCARFPALWRRRAPAFAHSASARKPHGDGCPAGLSGVAERR